MVERLADERASLLRAAGTIPPRCVARAADAGDDRPRAPRGASAPRRRSGSGGHVALDELGRIERIVDRLLLLAKADQPDFVLSTELAVEPFLEDVFMRWSEVAPRAWRLGRLAAGTLRRIPMASGSRSTNYSRTPSSTRTPTTSIELRSRASGGQLVIEVADEGCGVPAEAGALDLRPLLPRRRGSVAHGRRRRSRARDRRRHRQGTRRTLHARAVASGRHLRAPASRLPGGIGSRPGSSKPGLIEIATPVAASSH